MSACTYCSMVFPDGTYLNDRGVCGAGQCQDAYEREWGIVDKILDKLEKKEAEARENGYTPEHQGSVFMSLAYYPKCNEIEKRESIKTTCAK